MRTDEQWATASLLNNSLETTPRRLELRRTQRIRRLFVALLLAGAIGSASASQLRVSPLRNDCSLDGFTESETEYMIEDLAEPFRVRVVRGTIDSAGGGWPKEITVLVELRGSEPEASMYRVRTDGRGRFSLPGVPEGSYCFKATVAGWSSVVGKIEVAKKAPRRARIQFVMPLGV
jgi:hypothetical protein